MVISAEGQVNIGVMNGKDATNFFAPWHYTEVIFVDRMWVTAWKSILNWWCF